MSSEMFCIMLTGSPSATVSAAPPRFFAVGEQRGRAPTRKAYGDDSSPCDFRLAQLATASLADFTSGSAPEGLGCPLRR
eukprot:4746441-Prymnesium_polylepis.1